MSLSFNMNWQWNLILRQDIIVRVLRLVTMAIAVKCIVQLHDIAAIVRIDTVDSLNTSMIAIIEIGLHSGQLDSCDFFSIGQNDRILEIFKMDAMPSNSSKMWHRDVCVCVCLLLHMLHSIFCLCLVHSVWLHILLLNVFVYTNSSRRFHTSEEKEKEKKSLASIYIVHYVYIYLIVVTHYPYIVIGPLYIVAYIRTRTHTFNFISHTRASTHQCNIQFQLERLLFYFFLALSRSAALPRSLALFLCRSLLSSHSVITYASPIRQCVAALVHNINQTIR